MKVGMCFGWQDMRNAEPTCRDGKDRTWKQSNANTSCLIRSLLLLEDLAVLTTSRRDGLDWISGQKNAIMALSS